MISLLLLALTCFQEAKIKVDESLQVGYIMLDVTVGDSHGRPVTDLVADDFVVRENKKKIKVEVFQTLDFRPPGEGGPLVDPNEDPIQQTLILLLDLAATNPETALKTFSQLEAFLEARHPSSLQIFIFSLDMGAITPSFTTDPSQALDDLILFQDKFFKNPRNLVRKKAFNLATLETELASCLSRTRSAPGSEHVQGAGMIGTCLENAHDVFTTHQAIRTRKVLKVIGRLMSFLSRVDGLKSMYLVSPGFSLNAGESSARLVQAYRSQDGSVSGKSPFSNRGLNANLGNNPEEDSDFSNLFARIPSQLTLSTQSLVKEYQRITQLALASRVVFHTFGLSRQYRADRKASSVARAINVAHVYVTFSEEMGGGLSHLAHHTGGAFVMTNNPFTEIEKTLDKFRFYYVLGYVVPKGKKKKYRRIRVECKRPGVTLIHRTGYTPISN